MPPRGCRPGTMARFAVSFAPLTLALGCLSLGRIKETTIGTTYPDRLIDCRQLDKKITFYGTGDAVMTGIAGTSGLAAAVSDGGSDAGGYISAATAALAVFFHHLAERNNTRYANRNCNDILNNAKMQIRWDTKTQTGEFLDSTSAADTTAADTAVGLPKRQ